MISEIYLLNDWSEEESIRYHQSLGLGPGLINGYGKRELTVIVEDLEKAKMVLFENKTTEEK